VATVLPKGGRRGDRSAHGARVRSAGSRAPASGGCRRDPAGRASGYPRSQAARRAESGDAPDVRRRYPLAPLGRAIKFCLLQDTVITVGCDRIEATPATLAQPFPGLSDQGATSASGELGCITGRPLPPNFVRGLRGFKMPVRFAPRRVRDSFAGFQSLQTKGSAGLMRRRGLSFARSRSQPVQSVAASPRRSGSEPGRARTSMRVLRARGDRRSLSGAVSFRHRRR